MMLSFCIKPDDCYCSFFCGLKYNYEKNIFFLDVPTIVDVKIPSSLYRHNPILFVRQR